jgi:hypothetical protein
VDTSAASGDGGVSLEDFTEAMESTEPISVSRFIYLFVPIAMYEFG